MPLGQLIDPNTNNLTDAARERLRDILQAQYLSRFIKFPIMPYPLPFEVPGPRPDPVPFKGDPNPQTLRVRDHLLGELLIRALADPNPEPAIPSVITQIKKEGLNVEVIEELVQQFEKGAASLKSELANIQKCN